MSTWEECVKSAEVGHLAVNMYPGPIATFWHVLGNGTEQLAAVHNLAEEQAELHMSAAMLPPSGTPELFLHYMLTTERMTTMIGKLRDAIAVPALWEAQKR
jgi:hypothetical protein